MKLILFMLAAVLMCTYAEARKIVPPLSDKIAAPAYYEVKVVEEIKKPTIPEIIKKHAKNYGVDETLAVKIATCESRLNPVAKNKISSAGGLFQFLDSTWASSAKRYSTMGFNKFDPEANAQVAMAKMANEGYRAWNASKKCWG